MKAVDTTTGCNTLADEEPLPPDISIVLEDFADVFATPKGLPPTRSHDHRIPLQSNTTPVNSNPYKCPYIQKSEIEKIVKEMLETGIVRHNSRPFASPVLLVKKKR